MSDPVRSPRRSRESTRQLWAGRLGRFPASGLSVAAFCAAEGVSPNSFFYWKRRLAGPGPQADPAPVFLPIRVTPPAPVEVILANGTVLRVGPGCDPAYVRSLAAALAGEPC